MQAVLELLREGLTTSDIIADYYPDLAPDDIRACVQHAIEVLNAEENQAPEAASKLGETQT